MITLLVTVAVWFFLGWVGAKAILRYSKQTWPDLYPDGGDFAVAGLVFITGPIGYLVTWFMAFGTMLEIHSLGRLRGHGGACLSAVVKFFGESK